METEQTEAKEFSLHFLTTAARLFFFLEVVVLITLLVITEIEREIDYKGILAAFYGGLILSFLWSVFGIALNIRFARIRVDSDSISGQNFWGKRKRVQFSAISRVKVFNLLSIKLLRISSPKTTLWLMPYFANPNQFYTAVKEVVGSENLLCIVLKKLGLSVSQLESKEGMSPSKRKLLAISFGLFLLIISILVWGFGVINVFLFVETSAPSTFLSGGGTDQCSSVITLKLAWINLIWSLSLLIGVFVPTIMIWKNYDRRSVIIATGLGLAQNTFSFVFGIPFLYITCL